jgi:hypothetical protein
MRIRERKKPEFNISDSGYNVKAWYLKDTDTEKGDALIEIKKDGSIIRKFIFPGYKIWNIAAHFHNIINSEEEKNTEGYQIACSDGLGGCVMPKEAEEGDTK